jgi:hypothetical protein
VRPSSEWVFRSCGISTLLLGAVLSFPARSEEPKKTEEKQTEKPAGKSSTPEEPKAEAKPSDPTQPSAKLRQILRGPEKSGEVVKIPVEIPKPPEIALKGLIRTDGKPAAALIELKGRQAQIVREGAQISGIASDGASMDMIIKKISSDGVEIEIPKLKQTLFVR